MPSKHSDYLYLLAFIDITDRFDILLLEIRHLQKVIIDSLHAPTLFLPLRREEEYLFGGWVNHEECVRLLESEKNYAKVSSLCVTRYPSPDEAVKHISSLPKQNKEDSDINMSEKLMRFIGYLWAGDLWAGGERRHYHALRALQILKQQILRDKLIFLTEAKNADIVKLRNNRVTRVKAELMILRSGVITKINTYIGILRTHQQQFGKSLDFGLQTYPRPSIERRRDIGIYNDFLSNRTHDLQKDMFHFLRSFLDKKDSNDRPQCVKPMILHGWSQSTQVSSSELFDDVNIDLAISNEKSDQDCKNKTPEHVSYVDTSFWSPDRPDLQPLVAKQVAVSLTGSYLGGVNDNYLSNSRDPFSHLLVSLHKIVKTFIADTPQLAPMKKQYTAFINEELAVDFLAASIKGVSYLYALFLNILGEGLESQLRGQDKSIKLEMLNDLESAVRNYDKHFEWYFRLRIIAFWLQKTAHTQHSSLDITVIEGCREVCDEIVDYLTDNTPSTKSGIPAGSLWKNLADEMESYINKHAFTGIAKRWRLMRSKDTWCESLEESGKKVYHRSTIRLDLNLQRFLFRGTLQQKGVADYKPLTSHKKLNLHINKKNQQIRRELYTEFYETYGLETDSIVVPGHTKKTYKHPRWLYRHLHQIPFQCAIMRSIDLLGSFQEEKTDFEEEWKPNPQQKSNKHQPKPHHWKNFITEIHNDMSLGREKFSIGLEFYTWARESPRERLALSNNLIVFILPQLDEELEVRRHLTHWLLGDIPIADDTSSTDNDAHTIRRTIKEFSNSDLKKYDNGELLEKLGAETINRAFAWIKEGSCSEVRRMEQLAGYKLKALLAIYKQHVEIPCRENLKIRKEEKNAQNVSHQQLKKLLALGAFLKIRADNGKEDFYRLILQAFNNTSAKEPVPERIPPVMLSRSVLTNYYTTTDPFSSLDRNRNNNQPIYNAKTLHYGLTLGNWSVPVPNKKTCKQNKGEGADSNEHSGQFSTILGRYDVVGITPTRMPCKCRILNFNSKDDTDATDNNPDIFVNHFTRREVALPVNIRKIAKKSKTTLFGIISISLQRRAMRLNLLYRILSALDKKDNVDDMFPMVEESVIEVVGNHPGALSIQGYITDGWGDLLLVFKTVDGKNIDNEKLVDDIFYLQQMLYEDFMVDRTELIYTPKCIDYVSRLKNYDFSISVRLLEDRKLESSVDDFLQAFRSNQKKLIKALPNIISSSICLTPGKTDLTIRFKLKDNVKFDNFYIRFLDWMGNISKGTVMSTWYPDGMSMLDKVETTIESHFYDG